MRQIKSLKRRNNHLHSSSDEFVRMSAANSLDEFVTDFELGQKQKEKILRELIEQLLTDENSSAQKWCYEQVVRIIRNQLFGVDLPNYFDR